MSRHEGAVTLDQTPRVRRVLGLQTWIWRANVLTLLVTIVARTVMRPSRSVSGRPRSGGEAACNFGGPTTCEDGLAGGLRAEPGMTLRSETP